MANPNPKTAHLVPYQFKPGTSGRPPGPRRRLGSVLVDILESQELMGQTVPGGKTVGQALIESILARAIQKGDLSAFREIVLRVDGPPDPERDEIAGLSDAELVARITTPG